MTTIETAAPALPAPSPPGTADPVLAPTLAPTLAGHEYTDPAVFALERERIFSREWIYVGHVSQAARPGDVIRFTVGNESVIVVRGRDRQLRAFLNVCRHRGALLCLNDSGNAGKAIRCPYHAWTYALDGRLVTAPNWDAMSDVDKGGHGLHEVALDVWEGLVFVTLEADPPPLESALRPQFDYRFGTDEEAASRWRIADLVVGASRRYEVAANWKIIQENFQECYHCGTIHPELVEQVPMFRSFAELGTGGYHTDGYGFSVDKDAFSLTGRPAFERLPGLLPTDDRRYFGLVLRPNCFVSLLPDHVIVHRFLPLGPDRTQVVCDWLFQAHEVARQDFDPSDTVELFHRVNEQDFTAAEWCQPNMGSRAYRRGGVLVPTEAEIISNWYYAWYRRLMAVPEQEQGAT